MRLNTVINPVESGGILETNAFTIAVTGKVFDDLFDKRYPDKPKAIIRELSTNAKDAHAAAGRPQVPFEVRLPTKMVPRLRIVDYGTGMSHQQVMGLYTTAFMSTKDRSDDYTGGFGIGSKSPFAAVDQFTVESRFNGEKRVYACFRDDQRIPRIALLTAAPSGEPNGLTVEVPVGLHDITAWHEAAKKVLPYFDPLPKLNLDLGIGRPMYVVKGTNWGLRQTPRGTHYAYSHEARLIMGCIPYPIDKSQVRLTGVAEDLLGMPIDLYMPIGAVQILTNREGLEYDRDGRTASAVKAALGQVANEFGAIYQKEFASCTSLWEARRKFDRIVNRANLGYDLRRHLESTLVWNGSPIGGSKVAVRAPGLVHLTRKQLGNVRISLSASDEVTVDAGSDISILLDDLTTPHLGLRMKHNADQFPGDVLIIRAADPTLVLSRLGNPPTKRVQDLEAPPASVRKPYLSNVQPVTKWDGRWFRDHRHDVMLGGVYVYLDHYKPKRGDRIVDLDDFKKVVAAAQDLGIHDGAILGIPMTHKNVPKKNPGWVGLFDLVKTRLLDLIDQVNLPAQMASHNELLHLSNDAVWSDLVEALNRHKARPSKPNSRASKLLDAVHALRTGVLGSYAEMLGLASLLGVEVKASKPIAKLEKLIEEVKDRYALLNHVGHCFDGRSRSESVAALVQYIDLVDSKR